MVHTIADCYVENKFKDDTGFFYFDEDNEDSDTSSACYYNKPKYGTNLPTEGDNNSQNENP